MSGSKTMESDIKFIRIKLDQVSHDVTEIKAKVIDRKEFNEEITNIKLKMAKNFSKYSVILTIAAFGISVLVTLGVKLI
jgi:hypothetical protein